MEDNKNKTTKPVKKADKKPNVFVRMGRWFKTKFSGMISELKKVTWPKFSKVLKQTGVVLAVVLFFLIIVTAIDFGLTELLRVVGK